MSQLPKPTELAHTLLAKAISTVDLVVDATVGNGHDTRFLAGLVGDSGKVIGFDIQDEALTRARAGLDKGSPVELHKLGHERMGEIISDEVKAIMFNLGYLPSGDKSITTLLETTIPALNVASSLLAIGGLLTIVVYTGHSNGALEGAEVQSWAEKLDSHRFCAVSYLTINRSGNPPFLITIERVR